MPSDPLESLTYIKEYVVRYQYYRYNSGSMDNGEFAGEDQFSDPGTALKFANRIKQHMANTKIDSDLKDECFGGDGYFTKYIGCFERGIRIQEIRLDQNNSVSDPKRVDVKIGE